MTEQLPYKIWRKAHFTLRMYYSGIDFKQGKDRIRYQFKDGQKIIFEGNDFYCSPLHAIDSLETVYTLLEFLPIMPGDTDSEYFKDYSELQYNWVNSRRCEELSSIVNDWECRKDK